MQVSEGLEVTEAEKPPEEPKRAGPDAERWKLVPFLGRTPAIAWPRSAKGNVTAVIAA